MCPGRGSGLKVRLPEPPVSPPLHRLARRCHVPNVPRGLKRAHQADAMAEDPQREDTHQHPECVSGQREADKEPDKEGEGKGKREGEGSGETFTMEQEMKISDVEDKGTGR